MKHAPKQREVYTRRGFLCRTAGLAGMLMFPGCDTSTSQPERQRSSDKKEVPNETRRMDFFAEAAKPYQGLVIRGISDHTPPSAYARKVLAPAFEKETGIRIEFEGVESFKMWDRIHKDMESGSGIYDFVYVEQDFIYGYIEKKHLVNLTALFRQNLEMIAPTFKLSDFTSFIEAFKDPQSGDLYGVPMEGFIKAYVYRKDLFSDPDIRSSFFKKYGYALSPAITLAQYRDNAAFFTAYGKAEQIDLWGTTLMASLENAASFWGIMEMLPRFGVYNWGINLDGYKAAVKHGGQMNGERAKEAFAFWLDLLKYAPPDATGSTWTEIAATFAAGRAAQGLIYGEDVAWIATDATRSSVVGKVGVTLTPTLPEAMEQARLGQGYIDYYDGAAFGIPHGSRKKEAAMLWLQYIGLPRVQPQWALAASRVVHMATFDDPQVRAHDRKLGGYFSIMKKYGHLYAGSPPFPFIIPIRDAATPFFHQAIKGELSAAQAMDRVAVAVDNELIRLGYSK